MDACEVGFRRTGLSRTKISSDFKILKEKPSRIHPQILLRRPLFYQSVSENSFERDQGVTVEVLGKKDPRQFQYSAMSVTRFVAERRLESLASIWMAGGS